MTVAFVAIAAAFAAQGAVSAPTAANSPSTLGESTYVDLEGGVGYSSSPYFSLVGGGGRALVRASAHFVHTRYTARSSTTLSAYGENTTYLGRYGSQKLFSLSAHHDAAVNEKLRVFGDFTGSVDESGQLGTRFISVGPLIVPSSPAVPLPTLPDTQTAFLITNGRTYRVGGQAGGQLALSQASLTARVGLDHVLLRGTSRDNSYNIYIASLAYDRMLNARASVGGIVTTRLTDYKGGQQVKVVTPQATGHLALSDRMDLSGAIGVSFAKITNQGLTQHSTGLALNASLCNNGEKGQLCATIARDQQTATIAGPATVSSASLNFSKRIDAKQTFQLSVSVSRYSQPYSPFIGTSVVGRSTYVTGGAAYARQLNSRLFTGANLSVRKLFGDGPTPKADLSVSLFLRLRLGDRQ